MYAHITDGLDQEGKEKIDIALEGPNSPLAKRRQRETFRQLRLTPRK